MIKGSASSNQPRDFLGQFSQYKQDQITRALALAKEFQEDVAAQIQADIGTKATFQRAHTGRLVEATVDPRNIGPLKSTSWKVGIPEWLNHSQARYWRTFEHGSSGPQSNWRKPFKGTVLFGAFSEGSNIFVPASRLESGQARRYVVRGEIQGHESYRTAWRSKGWERRVHQEFTQVLGRHFGSKYKS